MSRELLREHMTSAGLTQAQIASQLDCSPATINQYLQGKYRGDVSKIDRSVMQLLERLQNKHTEVNTGFVATPTAKRIIEMCAFAHAETDIAIVIGDAGLGKTMALKQYAEIEPGVIFIESDHTYTPKVILQTLCDALGLATARNNHAMMDAIVKKLHGSERLIIVDEAELLKYQALEILRRIHDKAGIGVLLAGLPSLRANLRGSRGQYKQLYSRVGMQHDIKSSLPDSDIEMLAEARLGTDEFNAQLVKAAKGNARRLNKLLRGALRLAKINDRPVDAEMIARFADMLID